jgi:hypothetical protein
MSRLRCVAFLFCELLICCLPYCVWDNGSLTFLRLLFYFYSFIIFFYLIFSVFVADC